MNTHDLKLKLASIYSSKETGVPAPILTEMLYDVMKKINPEITRGSIRKVADADLSILQATKKLFSMVESSEVNQ